jgi:chromosome segregation ATPase
MRIPYSIGDLEQLQRFALEMVKECTVQKSDLKNDWDKIAHRLRFIIEVNGNLTPSLKLPVKWEMSEEFMFNTGFQYKTKKELIQYLLGALTRELNNREHYQAAQKVIQEEQEQTRATEANLREREELYRTVAGKYDEKLDELRELHERFELARDKYRKLQNRVETAENMGNFLAEQMDRLTEMGERVSRFIISGEDNIKFKPACLFPDAQSSFKFVEQNDPFSPKANDPLNIYEINLEGLRPEDAEELIAKINQAVETTRKKGVRTL